MHFFYFHCFFRRQILLVMKFLILFLFLGAFQASAKYTYAQEVTIQGKNMPLKKVFKEITQQSGYVFFYDSDLLKKSKPITVNLKKTSVEKALDEVFRNQPLTWSIVNKTITIIDRPIEEKPSISYLRSTDVIDVRGFVTDETGNPLIGVSVLVKGSDQGTSTNTDGMYLLRGVEEDATLVFSMIGYGTREIAVKNRTQIDVKMNLSIVRQEEISVNTGYQTLSKERTTGSYSIIGADQFEQKLQPTLKSALEGLASGMVLTKKGDVEIRGVSTISGVKAPLIVVDGFPLIGTGMGMETINPNNVESVTVLKDAVAASIYGARASNGVIVVTTKKPAKGSYHIGYKGVQSVELKPDLSKLNLASVPDFMDAELDLYEQDPTGYEFDYYDLWPVTPYQYLLLAKDIDLMDPDEADKQIEALRHNNALKQIQRKLLRPELTQSHNFSISGGNDKSLFNGDVRYVTNRGNMATNKNNRLTIDLKNVWMPKDWFTLRLLSNFNYTKGRSSEESYASLTSFKPFSLIFPYTQLYDDAGNPTPWIPVEQGKLETYATYPGLKPATYHPETDIPMVGTNQQNMQFRFGGDVNIKFTKFLNASFGGSWNKGASTTRYVADGESYIMRTSYNDATSGTNPTKHYIPEGGMIDEGRQTVESWVIRSQLNYNQSFGGTDHRVTAMIGNEISKDTYENVDMPTRLGYDPVSASYNSGFNPYDWNNNTGNMEGDFLFSGIPPTYMGSVSYGSNYGVRDNRFVSHYGNASYEYKNKYVVSGSARLDLTNFFGTDKKYRYKPTWSVGGKYKISEEPFFESLSHVINRLDLRGSLGVNGNISLNNTPYLILSVGNYSNTMGGVSYSISSYPNNQLRWERTKITNLGLDMTLLNNRVDLSFDYYYKKSTDLIVSDAVDQTRGVSTLPQNVGSVSNKGFEVTLGGVIADNRNFKWKSTLISSYNTSNVDYYNVDRAYFTSFASAAPILVQGYSMDGFWGAEFAGLNDEGIAQFYNSKGEKIEGGALTADDAKYLGTLRPKLDLGWTNTFRYKNFEASFLFIAKFGARYRKDAFTGSNYTNRHVGERWREPGDELTTIYPKLEYWNMDMFYFPYSDVLVGNANYLKLRDLTIGYNLPQSLVSRIGLTSSKIYFQTRNLFYVTAKGVDIDPETAEYNSSGATSAEINQAFTSLPLRPQFYFGISVNL